MAEELNQDMETIRTCGDCLEVFCVNDVSQMRCSTCQRTEAPDDTEVNYSRPEQPTRKFDKRDMEGLLHSLNGTIRRLEGMRSLDFGRNYLHYNESAELNRAKLTRMIVTKYIQQNP